MNTITKSRRVSLRPQGRRKVRELEKPDAIDSIAMFDIYEHVERAIKVDREFFLDRHYIVRDDEVVIVDENTGRLAEGRKWRDGIHQAIEAREGLTVSVKTGEASASYGPGFLSEVRSFVWNDWNGNYVAARVESHLPGTGLGDPYQPTCNPRVLARSSFWHERGKMACHRG